MSYLFLLTTIRSCATSHSIASFTLSVACHIPSRAFNLHVY